MSPRLYTANQNITDIISYFICIISIVILFNVFIINNELRIVVYRNINIIFYLILQCLLI